MKQMQKSSKTPAGAVFLRMRVVENQSKIVLKTTLCWDAKTTTQKCQKNGPTWLQIWSKLGPCWVPKSSWTCPRAKKCIPEAIRKEDQKKYRKTSVWGGPQAGSTRGGGGKWTGFGPHYNLLSTLAPIQQDLKTLRLQASKLLKGLYCTEASKTSTWSFSCTADWPTSLLSLVAPKGPADFKSDLH